MRNRTKSCGHIAATANARAYERELERGWPAGPAGELSHRCGPAQEIEAASLPSVTRQLAPNCLRLSGVVERCQDAPASGVLVRIPGHGVTTLVTDWRRLRSHACSARIYLGDVRTIIEPTEPTSNGLWWPKGIERELASFQRRSPKYKLTAISHSPTH